MNIIDKDFEDGNIRFTVQLGDNDSLQPCIRMIEVFNDNIRDNITYLRPIGFQINGFGTENQLYASEDFVETIIEIVRRLDKHSYRFTSVEHLAKCNQSSLVPSIRMKMQFNQPVIRFGDFVEQLSTYGIEVRDFVGDDILITNLKESLSLEIVFGLCKRDLTLDEASAVCQSKNSTEHYVCNVSTIGGVVYSLHGDVAIKVNCDIFVTDSEALYMETLSRINERFSKF